MSNTVHLNRRDSYDLGGKILTLSELQDAVIKARLYDELVEDIKEGRFS